MLATTSSETDRSDNDRKFVAFGRKNTGISQINDLDDLYQGLAVARPRPRPYIWALRPRPRTNITAKNKPTPSF